MLTQPIIPNNQKHQNIVALNMKSAYNNNLTSTNNTDVLTISAMPSNNTMSPNFIAGSSNVENEMDGYHPPRKVIKRGPPAALLSAKSPSINTHSNNRLNQPILPKPSKTLSSASPIIDDSIILPEECKLSSLRSSSSLANVPGSNFKKGEISTQSLLAKTKMTVNSMEASSSCADTPFVHNAVIPSSLSRTQKIVLNNSMVCI